MNVVYYYESEFFNSAKSAIAARKQAGGYRNIQVYEANAGYRASRLQGLHNNHGWEEAAWRGGLRQIDYISSNGDTGSKNWNRATRPRRTS